MSKASEDPFAVLQSFEPKGILLDTNLLVVYIVGLVDKSLVGRVKRTENFLPEDADFLLRRVSRYARRVTTPGIWAEASNLLESFFASLPLHVLKWLQTAIREEIAIIEEHWVPAKQIASDDQLLLHGFTDLAIAEISRDNILVLTADFPLAVLLQKRRLPCVNYHTLRFKT